jgi:hypothetical protein
MFWILVRLSMSSRRETGRIGYAPGLLKEPSLHYPVRSVHLDRCENDPLPQESETIEQDLAADGSATGDYGDGFFLRSFESWMRYRASAFSAR